MGWLLIAAHYLLFSQFFPNAQGKLGHDYAYDLPMLLDGYYWFQHNGFHALPWFSPSFCGGMPLLANPATFYLSTAQFLTFLVGPLAGVKLTLLLFATFGFWGFYLLLTRIYRVTPWPALLGGALFLFNGFFAYRFIVGHLEFHAFMLVPLIGLLLLAEPEPGRLRNWRIARNVGAGGVLIAYMFLAGMTQLMIPALMTVVLFALVKRVIDEDCSLPAFFFRFIGAGAISLGLSGAKLVAALSFLSNFPRESYSLPGVDGFGRLFGLLFETLALGGAGIDGSRVMTNFLWAVDRHEFEYGVGLVPFIVLLAGLFLLLRRWRQLSLSGLRRPGILPCLGAIGLLLAVPVLLNYYTPAWNSFLKTVPLLKSLSNFMRWFAIYIPMIILASVLVLARSAAFRGRVNLVVWAGLVLLLIQNLATDRGFYHNQPYDPTRIEAAYRTARSQGGPPKISRLTASTDGAGDRNDALVNGESQLLCYEPMFGFRLEFLPFKNIHPGPVLDSDGRVFNFKNPACYLYPRENGCEPGDHFRLAQLDELAALTSFRPFIYQKSMAQRVADWLSLLTFVMLVISACFYLGLELRNGWSRRGLAGR